MRRPAGRRALWVSTSTHTRGGVASYVRTMRTTPLWVTWHVAHVATHQDGGTAVRVLRFVRGGAEVVLRLLLRPPAVLHLHTASYGSFARKSTLALVARLRRVPVVLHVHGAAFEEFHDAAPRWLRRHIRRTLTSAAVVVALGDSWAVRLARIAPRARIEVVPNAVVPGPVPEPAAPGDPVGVLFLGRLSEDKGVLGLLEAWAGVRARLPDVEARLVLAGEGPELDRLRRRVGELGLGDSVDLPGWVEPARVPPLVAAAQVLVLPSRWEGQPMAILEAMAGGLAVVACRVGGVPDLVDADSGVLVDPDDPDALLGALLAVLADPDARAAMGAAGRARVERDFDVDVTWRRLEALYEEIA